MEFLPAGAEEVDVAVVEKEDRVVGSCSCGRQLATHLRVHDGVWVLNLFGEFCKIFGVKCRSRSALQPVCINVNLSFSGRKLFAWFTV